MADKIVLYPTGEVAKRASISALWVRKLCDLGKIDHVRDVRGQRLIPQEALALFLAERRRARRKR